MQFNILGMAMLVSAVLSLSLGLYALKHKAEPTAFALCLMMAGMAIWSLAGAMEAMVVTLPQKTLWSAVSYIGITSMPVLFLILALKYSGHGEWLRGVHFAGLAVLPLMTIGIAFTNGLHGWLWSNIYLTETWIGVTAVYERGFWFWIWAAAGHVAVGGGMVLLALASLNMQPFFARQARIMMLAPLVPLAANISYILNPGLRHGIDYTPFFFTASILLIALAIFHNRWLEVMPLPSHVLVRKLRDGILVFDAAERLIGMNPAAQHYMSLTETDYGNSFADVMKSLPVSRSLLEADEDLALEVTSHQDDVTLELRHIPVLDSRGRVHKHLITLRDLTARERAKAEHDKLQAQLLQAQKMESVGRLASGVAHDFNSLLTAIMGYTELSLYELGTDTVSPVREHIERILHETQRSAGIVRQLLAYARKQAIQPEVLSLNFAIEKLIGMLHRLIGENIELIFTPGEAELKVEMDPSQLDQVLVNLVVNARDAIGSAGRITIETGNAVLDRNFCAVHPGCVPGTYIMMAVRDTGCGMDRETLTQIFEPFFTTKDSGSGLGLSTVYGIIKQNKGYVYADSEPGEGACFRIYFTPITTSTGVVESIRDSTVIDTTPCNLLDSGSREN